MARLEKRRMTETANNSSTTTILKAAPQSTSLMTNGMSGSHGNTNEIENLLFKHEHDTNPLSNEQYSVTIPENILLNQQMTNSLAHYSATVKRQHSVDEQASNGPLSPSKKARLGTLDGTKMANSTHPSAAKPTKKSRNKQQQQTIIKTAASGVFPQQQQQQQQQQAPQPTMALQNMDQTSDDVSDGNKQTTSSHGMSTLSALQLSKVLQMMGNEMNFLNQHLQTTSILLQKQLDLARDSLHACSVQFTRTLSARARARFPRRRRLIRFALDLKRMIQQQI